jgi:hypothetical protein
LNITSLVCSGKEIWPHCQFNIGAICRRQFTVFKIIGFLIDYMV